MVEYFVRKLHRHIEDMQKDLNPLTFLLVNNGMNHCTSLFILTLLRVGRYFLTLITILILK